MREHYSLDSGRTGHRLERVLHFPVQARAHRFDAHRDRRRLIGGFLVAPGLGTQVLAPGDFNPMLMSIASASALGGITIAQMLSQTQMGAAIQRGSATSL